MKAGRKAKCVCKPRKAMPVPPPDLVCPVCAAFGRVLRAERLRQGRSQTELARAAGVGRSSVSDVEAGKGGGPELDWGTRIGFALGVPFDELARRARLEVAAAEAKASTKPQHPSV